MSEMEEKILLASNANEDIFDNKLNHFKNILPKAHLSSHKKWKIGIESFSFNCSFVNKLTSINNTHPVLIMFHRGYLNNQIGYHDLASTNYPNVKTTLRLNSFSHTQCYYLEAHINYTLNEIHETFLKQTYKNKNARIGKFVGYPTRYNQSENYLEFGQFDYKDDFKYENSSNHKYEKSWKTDACYLLLHENFFNHIKVLRKTHIINTVLVDNHRYYWILYSHQPMHSLNDEFPGMQLPIPEKIDSEFCNLPLIHDHLHKLQVKSNKIAIHRNNAYHIDFPQTKVCTYNIFTL